MTINAVGPKLSFDLTNRLIDSHKDKAQLKTQTLIPVQWLIYSFVPFVPLWDIITDFLRGFAAQRLIVPTTAQRTTTINQCHFGDFRLRALRVVVGHLYGLPSRACREAAHCSHHGTTNHND